MTIYQFQATRLDGEVVTLDRYQGKVALIVNTASKCGFTPQYEGLQALYQEFEQQGLVILGFPCDQFRHQEPGDDDEIASFCQKNYGVSFDMFSKIEVNGADTHPLYRYLKQQARGLLGTQGIKWNFTKFLVSRSGEVIKRYGPTTLPEQIRQDIVKQLS